MNYRAKIASGKAAADGTVHFDCWIERESEPDVWEVVPMGHRTLVRSSATILSITESEMSDQEKLDALCALLCEEATNWGIHKSDDAYNQMYDLLPTGWPVNVDLE